MRIFKLIVGALLLMAATACTVYEPGYRYHYYSYDYPQHYSYYRYAP